MNQNSTTKNNQENKNGYEGVFTRARAHAHTGAPTYAHTHENPKFHSRIPLFPLLMAFAVVMIVGVGNVWGQSPVEQPVVKLETPTSNATWTIPTGAYQITKIQAWGGGGGGGNANKNGLNGVIGSGGGGGAYANYSPDNFKLSSTSNRVIVFTVGNGGTGGNPGGSSSLSLTGTERVNAGGGSAGNSTSSLSGTSVTGGGGGTVTTGSGFKGGTGGAGRIETYKLNFLDAARSGRKFYSGGGGGGAGTTGGEKNASNESGGSATNNGGGKGADGVYKDNGSGDGNLGFTYGGGGSGACHYGLNDGNHTGGKGGDGAVWITYTTLTLNVKVYADNGFNSNYESKTLPYYNQYNTILPSNPTKRGYTHEGWFTNAACSAANKVTITDNCTKEQNFDLYAKWEAKTVAIETELGGGSVSNMPSSLKFDQEVTLPTPTRLGYVFLGWYVKQSNNEYRAVSTPDDNMSYKCNQDEISFPATGNGGLTLYAKWEARDYKIVFKANSDYMLNINPEATGLNMTWNENCFENIDNTNVHLDSISYTRSFSDAEKVYANHLCVDQPNALTCNGYVITGWYTAAGYNAGSQKIYNSGISATDISWPEDGVSAGTIRLYAHWREAYYCYLHGEGGTFSSACTSDAECRLVAIDDGYSFEMYETGAMNAGLATCTATNTLTV